MLEIVALLCLVGALALLLLLSAIDLRDRLLPNELVLGFLALGVVFHLCTLFAFLDMTEMALGALTGAGILYIIRAVATKFYGEDALGLGDVKLMGAAGVWLGPYYILIALTLGALMGIVHGLGMAFRFWRATKEKPNFSTLSLPAGPGFAAGIVMTAIVKFASLPGVLAG